MNLIIGGLALIWFSRELELLDKWFFWVGIIIYFIGFFLFKIVRFYLRKIKSNNFNKVDDIGKLELKRQVEAIYKGQNG